jgi:uncharacterized protein (DUF885 family)
MCHLPNGKKEYEYMVFSSLSQRHMTIDEIHEFGKMEVERIMGVMRNIQTFMGVSGTHHDFFKYIRNRKDLHYSSKSELLKTYKNKVKDIEKNIMPKLFYRKVKTPCSVEAVPKYNEKYSSEAYYMEGDLNGTRPGKFFINLRDIKDNSKIEVESLTLHEASPGHHYQLSYVNESKDIPLFVKVYGIDSYLEGWALYCENLGEYETLESYFGKLVMELIRALRLVVDTGIHYYGWSYDKTFNYYKQYGFDTDEQVHGQLRRYISIPSQALSYKIGERCIIECLNEYRKGGGTNMKQFHKLILENGAIPLYLLRNKFGLKN